MAVRRLKKGDITSYTDHAKETTTLKAAPEHGWSKPT
jgi:hypothetical protein